MQNIVTFSLLFDDTSAEIHCSAVDWSYSNLSFHKPLACYQWNVMFQIDVTRNSCYFEYNKIALLSVFSTS